MSLVAGSAGVVFALSPQVNYDSVRAEVGKILEEDEDMAPTMVRLAWHASGTYSCISKDGGSEGGTMRFAPEKDFGANAGLDTARDALMGIKSKYPGISYGDLWTLAGCVAIESMGGPTIDWRPGREDRPSGKHCPPDGRLPDGALGAEHIRNVFNRMDFSDREIVALAGAHSVGRCHRDRSGFEGPWSRSPTTWSTEYYRELLENTWTEKKWDGPRQFEDPTGDLMMLPTDMALVTDLDFKKWVNVYANDEERFNQEFSRAFKKLLEQGVRQFEKERF